MNKWALILGASSGIGAESAIALSKKGINIYGVYLRKPNHHVQEIIKKIKQNNVDVIFKKINAANHDSISEVMEELDEIKDLYIKVFIHSIAFGALKPMINKDVSKRLNKKNIEMTLDVMSNTLVYWAQKLFDHNLIKKGSQIISMTSAGSYQQWQAYGAVSMAKAALESATRQLAFELAPYKISCNAIQAGVTQTPALEKIPGYQKMIKNAKHTNPHRRLTKTSDIAKAAVLLGLSNNYWLTGNTIKVDGGESLTS
jgi:enoyl-[acyl-carrier-protein] reductase (NADH)